jgi:hypothetical protein
MDRIQRITRFHRCTHVGYAALIFDQSGRNMLAMSSFVVRKRPANCGVLAERDRGVVVRRRVAGRAWPSRICTSVSRPVVDPCDRELALVGCP